MSNKLAFPPNKIPCAGFLVCPAAIKPKDKGAPEHFTAQQLTSQSSRSFRLSRTKALGFRFQLAPSQLNRLPGGGGGNPPFPIPVWLKLLLKLRRSLLKTRKSFSSFKLIQYRRAAHSSALKLTHIIICLNVSECWWTWEEAHFYQQKKVEILLSSTLLLFCGIFCFFYFWKRAC